jgi:hypothetical protein
MESGTMLKLIEEDVSHVLPQARAFNFDILVGAQYNSTIKSIQFQDFGWWSIQ